MPKRKRLVHRGVEHDRTKVKDFGGRREKVFARAWEKENVPQEHGIGPIFFPGVMCSTLEALMMKDGKLTPVSQETATAVATIFQWFGSPVGFSVLVGTLRKAGYQVGSYNEK